MDNLVNIYLLADKYDIPKLRQRAINELSRVANREIPALSRRKASLNDLVDCIARVCGPDALQSADGAMKARVIKICQEHSVALLPDKEFLHRYSSGELFDTESATAFGMKLGGLVLTSKGIEARESDGFPNPNDDSKYTTNKYVMEYSL